MSDAHTPFTPLLTAVRMGASGVRFLLPLSLLTLVCTSCTSAEKRAARTAQKAEAENSRAVEERRLRAVDGREIASKRGAEIFVADPHKTFDPARSPGLGSRAFSTGNARVKEFNYAQRVDAQGFRTKDFSGSKTAWMGDSKFKTTEARTKGAYATKSAEVKTAPTKDAREADKTVETRALPGSDRAYLGPETAKMKQPLDQMNLPRTSNELTELKTVEDIRELLNKNK